MPKHKMIKIICVVGARPNFIKMMPIMKALKQEECFDIVLVHTGQHFSPNMSDIFFKDLNLPQPQYFLNVGALTPVQQMADIMKGFENILLKENPNIVLVVGDVTSTLATALTAHKMGIRVAHVEAGVRSFDRSMPEEMNRILTDQISDFLFITHETEEKNLLLEGVDITKIFKVGNVMVDSLLMVKGDIEGRNIPIDITRPYAVCTLHRQKNVDDPKQMCKMFEILGKVSECIPLVMPIHPRTKKQLQAFHIEIHKNIRVIEPIGYLDFLALCHQSECVLTDSGGLQVETSMLNIPCLTLRDTTEWHVTIDKGTNTLLDIHQHSVVDAVQNILKGQKKQQQNIDLWDGKSSQRIAKRIKEKMFFLSKT